MRSMHFVGSTPHDSANEAAAWMLSTSDGLLHSLPNGEPEPKRTNWCQYVFDNLADLDELELASPANWAENQPPRLQIKRGSQPPVTSIAKALAYADYAVASFEALRPHLEASNLPYQVGIPSDVVAAAALRAPGIPLPRKRKLFQQATVHEIEQIHNLIDTDVVFQLELPMETVALTKAPKLLRPLLAKKLGKAIADLVARTPANTRFIAHLCQGDFNKEPQKALGQPDTLEPVVLLAQALFSAWPTGRRPLERIHIPVAYGEHPPPLNSEYYKPLRSLTLPEGTHLVAGLAHEDQSFNDQRVARDLVEEHTGAMADIAASCGLGRRTLDQATYVTERTRALLD